MHDIAVKVKENDEVRIKDSLLQIEIDIRPNELVDAIIALHRAAKKIGVEKDLANALKREKFREVNLKKNKPCSQCKGNIIPLKTFYVQNDLIVCVSCDHKNDMKKIAEIYKDS